VARAADRSQPKFIISFLTKSHSSPINGAVWIQTRKRSPLHVAREHHRSPIFITFQHKSTSRTSSNRHQIDIENVVSANAMPPPERPQIDIKSTSRMSSLSTPCHLHATSTSPHSRPPCHSNATPMSPHSRPQCHVDVASFYLKPKRAHGPIFHSLSQPAARSLRLNSPQRLFICQLRTLP